MMWVGGIFVEKFDKVEAKNIFLCIVGSFLYCLGINFFVSPIGLYSGGFIGVSQLLSLLFDTPLSRNGLQSLLFFLINIPLFILAVFLLGRRFISKSVVTILAETAFLALIPIPEEPIVEEMLTNCIIAGIIEAFGSTLIYVSFGSGGGTDILGMLLSRKFRVCTIGRVAIFINLVVYGISAFVFSIEIAVYSLLTSVICSLLIDRLHMQNNCVTVNILSKKYQDVAHMILTEINRAATIIECVGAYTEEEKKMVVSVMSEYELRILKRRITEIDDRAFVFINPHVTVMGNFEKRLSD
jgi:uncharacterized membrane-anchored protein YitT (DUF2179 family)